MEEPAEDMQQASTTKSGRVRKKSAKVLEMEAAEELERKVFSSSGSKGKNKKIHETAMCTVTEETSQDDRSVIKHLLSKPSPEKSGVPVFRMSPSSQKQVEMAVTKKSKSNKNCEKVDPTKGETSSSLSSTVDQLRNRLEMNTGVTDNLKLHLNLGALDSTAKVPDAANEKTSKKKSKQPVAADAADTPSISVQTDNDSGLKLKLVLSPKDSFSSKQQPYEVQHNTAKEPLKRKKFDESSDISARKIKIKKVTDDSSVFSHGIKIDMNDDPGKTKKKKKKDAPEKGRHPVVAARLSHQPVLSNLLTASYQAGDDPVSPDTQYDSEMGEEQNLVIAENVKTKIKKQKVKKEKKMKVTAVPDDMPSQIFSPKIKTHMDIGGQQDTDQLPVYSDTQEMALKLQTSKEKKMNKKVKQKKGEQDKPKRRRGLTAYMMWCNSYRNKVISENPGIDFAQISKRLGEIWQSLPSKDKLGWKRKAKRFNAKSGASLISTGKVAKSVLKKSGQIKPEQECINEAIPVRISGKSKAVMPAAIKTVSKIAENVPSSPTKFSTGTSALDVAAHLKLIGESLSIIGARLQEHQGQIAVQGSLSVLLDSLLCTLGPLACMTSYVPELDGCPASVHSSTLDNIAYIMPGL